MRELRSEIFGKKGPVHDILRIGIPITLGILALYGIYECITHSKKPLFNSENAPKLILPTPFPSPTFVPNTPTPKAINCRVIKPGESAYGVWRSLGQLPIVDFWDLAGLGATGDKETIRIGTEDYLPNPVQPGDELGPEGCVP
jgi:hypothetical protein